MSWTQYPDTKFTYAEEKAEIVRICGWTVLQASKVGSTWYCAVRNPKGAVLAVVILINYQGGFAYNDMNEDMGPNEARAPMSLIRKLSPTENAHSLDWRERCARHASQPKFMVGDKIVLSAPAIFGEHRLTEFTLTTYERYGKPRKCFHNPKIGLCRLGRYALLGAVLA